MSVRRVKGSYRNSLRRFGSGDPNKAVRNSAWIFRNGEWRLIFDDGEEACLLYAKHEVRLCLCFSFSHTNIL